MSDNDFPSRDIDTSRPSAARMYHYYLSGQALFDARNPVKLLDRTERPFLRPTEAYERTGQYPEGTTFVPRWHSARRLPSSSWTPAKRPWPRRATSSRNTRSMGLCLQ